MSTGQRRGRLALVLATLLPIACVVSSCANVIGLDSVERVACVVGCGDLDATTHDARRDVGAPGDGGHRKPAEASVDVRAKPESGAPRCSKDGDCKTSMSPRCDLATGACVPCLPTNDNCAKGTICKASGTSYACEAGCATAGDCTFDASGGSESDAGDGGSSLAPACCSNFCVNTVSNADNCGKCGQSCSTAHMATVTCGAGLCSGMCDPGYGDCDNDKLTNGCETLVEGTDITNCGGCGTMCSANNIATVTCAAGACAGMCNAGYADCDHDKQSDGCEVELKGTDPQNCGACGTVCSPDHMATVSCAAGVCNGTCAAGYADCDGDLQSNGCEVLIGGTDTSNCGGCGTTCSANHMATVTCGAGVCDGTCAAGYGDCNGNKQTDGCETALNTTSDCGICGKTCLAGDSCTGGVCTGCLAGGLNPPAACTTGLDSSGVSWAVCTATCAGAFLSSSQAGGGNYHALAVCNSLGYGTVGPDYAGNCGTTCSASATAPCPAASCAAPVANPVFTLAMPAGDIIFDTVSWECLP